MLQFQLIHKCSGASARQHPWRPKGEFARSRRLSTNTLLTLLVLVLPLGFSHFSPGAKPSAQLVLALGAHGMKLCVQGCASSLQAAWSGTAWHSSRGLLAVPRTAPTELQGLQCAGGAGSSPCASVCFDLKLISGILFLKKGVGN